MKEIFLLLLIIIPYLNYAYIVKQELELDAALPKICLYQPLFLIISTLNYQLRVSIIFTIILQIIHMALQIFLIS